MTADSNSPVDSRSIVATGYDAAGAEYERWLTEAVVDTARAKYLRAFSEQLPAGAPVLELGCGGGGPATQDLAARFDLVGIDISERQVKRARARVPGAAFAQADMTEFHADPETFDGVAALYSLIHLPFGELPSMLVKIATWLRPGGLLLASFAGRGAGEHLEPEWLGGVPMYWSGHPTTETLGFVRAAALEVMVQAVEANVEDGEAAPFLWVLARKPLASAGSQE